MIINQKYRRKEVLPSSSNKYRFNIITPKLKDKYSDEICILNP